MTTASKPLAEVTATAIRLLCREIGPANTARFLNQFTGGFGDYTKERDEIVGESTVEGLLAEIETKRSSRAAPKHRRKRTK